MSSRTLSIETVSCPSCGAPTDFNPEDVLVTCQFCGTTFTRGQQEIPNHKFIVPKYSLAEAEKKIHDWIRKKTRFRGVKSVTLVKAEKLLIPYWVMHSRAVTNYRGYRRETYSETETVGSGENKRTVTKTITVYIPVNETIDEERYDPLICRMGAIIFGHDEINKRVRDLVMKQYFEDFSVEALKDAPEKVRFLNGEIKQSEAKELIETHIQDEHRSRARADTTELFDCRTNIELKGMLFLHFPVVYAEYQYGKETYRVIMDGNSGKILLAELPITTRFRIMAELATFITLFFIWGAAWLIIPDAPNTFNNSVFYFFVVSAILFLVGLKTNSVAWATESRVREK